MAIFTTSEVFGSSPFPSDDEVGAFISEIAPKFNIPPQDALDVWAGEGKGAWQSNSRRGHTREPSYGPFQLLKGGPGTGFPTGLGNAFEDETGLDPSDPANWKAATEYALKTAGKEGWGQWYGAPARLRGVTYAASAPAEPMRVAPRGEPRVLTTEEVFAQEAPQKPKRTWDEAFSEGKKEFFTATPEELEAFNEKVQGFPTPAEAAEPIVALGKLVAGGAEGLFGLPQISDEKDLARETYHRFKNYFSEEGLKENIAEHPGEVSTDVLGLLLGGRGFVRGGKAATPQTTKTQTPVPNQVLEAAGRAGVEVPSVAMRHPQVQNAATKVSQLPFVGAPLEEAASKAITQIGDAKTKTRQTVGLGDPELAGEMARKGLATYSAEKHPAIENAYKQVDSQINPNAKVVLSNTIKELDDINRRRAASGLPPTGDFLGEALTRPGGLTYDGIKFLRSEVGERIKEHKTPADIPTSQIERLYGALSRDLEKAVTTAGGPAALKTWQYANNLTRLIAQRRERVSKLLGAKNDEGLVDRLLATASTGSRSDTKLLTMARGAMDKASWRELSSAAIEKLGKDKAGEFSPERFITSWNKISPQGKALLFDKTVRQSLNDIATLSTKFNDLNRYTNTSKTGASVFTFGAAGGLLAEPMTTLASIIGGRMLASLLSKPATIKHVVKWTRAYTARNQAALAAAARDLAIAISALTQRPDLKDRIAQEIQGIN